MVLLILSHCEDQMRCNLKCLSKYLANKHETVAIITSRIPESKVTKVKPTQSRHLSLNHLSSTCFYAQDQWPQIIQKNK